MQVPNAHPKTEVLFSKGTDRADVDDVAGVFVIDRFAGKCVYLAVIAALEYRQLVGVSDFAEKARASRAQDASFLVEHHARADINRLTLVIFFSKIDA